MNAGDKTKRGEGDRTGGRGGSGRLFYSVWPVTAPLCSDFWGRAEGGEGVREIWSRAIEGGVPMWCSELRIHHCCNGSVGHNCSSDFSLVQERPHAAGTEKQNQTNKPTINCSTIFSAIWRIHIRFWTLVETIPALHSKNKSKRLPEPLHSQVHSLKGYLQYLIKL